MVRDIGFDIELLPSAFDYTIDGNTSRSGSDEFDRSIGIVIGCPYSFAGPGDSHGFLAAGELALSQSSYGAIGHLTRYGVRVVGGYGYAFSDSLSFTAMAKLGYGLATFDLSANSAFPALSATGTTLTYGLMLGADYTFSDRFLAGIKVGYLKMADKLSGTGVDITIDNAGLAFALGFSYRFSNSPRTLQ